MLYAAYSRMKADVRVQIPNVRLLRAVTVCRCEGGWERRRGRQPPSHVQESGPSVEG